MTMIRRGWAMQGFLATGVSLWVFFALNSPWDWGSQTPRGEQGRKSMSALVCTGHFHSCSILPKPEKVGNIIIPIL